MHKVKRGSLSSGFSLIQISVLVAVAAIIMASVLPGGQVGSDAEKDRVTKQRMEKIGEAMRTFMARNYRLPCPGSGVYAVENASFGKEGSTPGDCYINGAVQTNFADTVTTTGTVTVDTYTLTAVASTVGITAGMLITAAGVPADARVVSTTANTVTMDSIAIGPSGAGIALKFHKLVAGAVPTRSLNLPDEYAADGYGRRFMYIVDNRATEIKACAGLQTHGLTGDIKIIDTSTVTACSGASCPNDSVMWSLISYGKDGHGAFPMQGSAAASRINTGAFDPETDAVDSDTVNNTFADITMSTITITGNLVRKAPTTGFDDTVWTLDTIKNTCCIGGMCGIATHVTGNGAESNIQFAVGDFNGDTIQDIAFPMLFDTATSNDPTVYVVYGKKKGWTPPPTLTAATDLDDRTLGFRIRFPNGLGSSYAGSMTLAAGDTNGDGYDDLLVSTSLDTDGVSGPYQQLWLFRGRASGSWLAENLAETLADGATGFVWEEATAFEAGGIALADTNGDGYKDIVIVAKDDTGYIILSKGAGWATCIWAATPPLPCSLSVNYDVSITSTDADKTFSAPGAGTNENDNIAIGDFNNDTYEDIVLTSPDLLAPTPSTGHAFILFGRNTWIAGGATDAVDLKTDASQAHIYDSSYTAAPQIQFAVRVTAADVNDDGTKDLIFTSLEQYIEVVYGPFVPTDVIDINGTADFRIDHYSFAVDDLNHGADNWNTHITGVVAADLDGDNRTDIIIGNSDGSPGVGASETGVVFLFPQPKGGWISGTDYLLYSDTTTVGPYGMNSTYFKQINSYEAGDATGTLGVGDVNGDGKPDLLIGAAGYPTTASPPTGIVYVMYGRKNVPWPVSTALTDLMPIP